MLKTLADSELVDYRPYEGAILSDSGRLLAFRMLRRHRLIEQFLVETLKLSWDQVHEEAENMEHAVSEFLIDRWMNFSGILKRIHMEIPFRRRMVGFADVNRRRSH